MKKTPLLVGAFLCAICSFAQGEYPVNFDKDSNLAFTYNARQTSSVSITVDGEEQTIDVLAKGDVTYRDFSDQTFTVQPGAEIVPSMAYAGQWMHGYVYLDTNNNGAFDVNGYEDLNDELVAFSFYSPTDASTGVNGIGESKQNNCNVTPMNAFKAPEKPGQYRMRYIVDWNCIDPAGQYGDNYAKNYIDDNGGVIIDVTLVVEGGAPVVPEYNTTTKYFTAPELRAEADATGKALIAINNVTSTGNKYITGLQAGDKVSEDGTLAGARAPYEEEVLEMIPAEGGYILRQAVAEEGEGYIGLSGNNFTITVAGDATVWTVLGPGEDGYGNVSGFDDLYTDIEHSLNDNMVRFIVNGNQYMNGQGYGNLGGVRGGTGAWSFNYIYNANYTEGGEVIDPVDPVDPVDPEPPVVVDPVEYGPVLLSAGDNLVSYHIHNLGANDGNYMGNDCYVKYVAEMAGTWNSLFHTDSADDADKFAFFAAEDGGVYIKDVTADKFVTWKQNAEGGIDWGSHQLTACQVTLVDAMEAAKSWFIVDDENTEGRYDILPLESANNGWSFMGGIDQDFVVLNLEKKTDRNIKWVFEQVEEETPVDPVEPEELIWSPVSSGNTYAIVNLQPTEINYYLNYVDGNLSTIDATECNSLYEWPETAKFQAIELADGRFAFKNIGTGNYLAWKGTANRNNTTGAYNNCGYNPEINEMSSWTMNESTRFEGGYWFRAEQRNEIPNDGANLTGTFVIGNDGAWNAWTDGECTMATFSNTFGFVLLEEGEAPEPPIVEPTFDYAAAVAPVLAEANEVLEGHDNVLVTTVSDKLITRNDQFSSPHSDRAEGSTNNLLDGAANTFWHSDWHAGNQPAHSHYLQVALDEAIEGDVILTFVRRNAANDQVTLLDVETSMDGENFAHAAYIDMPNSGAGQTEQKVFALEEKAKFLRFWADATTTNRGYWHVGDFQLQTTKTELDIDAPDYAYPTAVAELQAAIAAAQAVENGTQADVDALAAAVAAYKAALAGYPEFTEWTGEMEVVTGEVSNIDDLLNVCVKFNRAATLAQSEIGVLGAIFDETGDVYALAFDQLCGGVDCEAVKSEGFVGHVANVHFDKIDDLTFGLQSSAKALAAKIGGFAPEAGVAHVVLASNSFIVDGEKLTEFKKVTFNIAAGSITSVETVVLNSKGEIFDLQGRRASKAQNGLFIQNGKKVIK